MKSVRLVLSVAIVLLVGASAWAKPIAIPRHPDYHAGKIVFSYLGDIWMVNEDGSKPAPPDGQSGTRSISAVFSRREVDRVLVESLRQLRCVRDGGGRRRAEAIDVSQRQ